MTVIIKDGDILWRDEEQIAEIRRMANAFGAVLQERRRQESLKAAGKFAYSCADAELSDLGFLAVLAEEFGEVAHEVNELIGRPEKRTLEHIRRMHAECIQVAAVAVARAELYQREIDAADGAFTPESA